MVAGPRELQVGAGGVVEHCVAILEAHLAAQSGFDREELVATRLLGVVVGDPDGVRVADVGVRGQAGDLECHALVLQSVLQQRQVVVAGQRGAAAAAGHPLGQFIERDDVGVLLLDGLGDPLGTQREVGLDRRVVHLRGGRQELDDVARGVDGVAEGATEVQIERHDVQGVVRCALGGLGRGGGQQPGADQRRGCGCGERAGPTHGVLLASGLPQHRRRGRRVSTGSRAAARLPSAHP